MTEEPTPLSELPADLQEVFTDREVRGPLAALRPDVPTATFDGVHIIERDDMTVVVGLDTTGSMLCLATKRPGSEASSSGCGSMAGFMMDISRSSSWSIDGQAHTVAFVPNGVVAIEIGSRSAPVERNIAILDGPQNDVLRLVYADGSTEPAESIPDPQAKGELVIDGLDPIDITIAGCSIIDGQVQAEAVFLTDWALISATVAPEGVVLGGGFDEGLLVGFDGDAVEVADLGAATEIDQSSGTLVVTSNWSDGALSGTLTIDCGDRLVDLSQIR